MQVKKGFTLIELSLSLAFIAILSLTIAFIINESVVSYRRGVTLKRINTTGIGLVDDMRAAIQNSSTKSLKDDCKITYGFSGMNNGVIQRCENDGAKNFVTLTKTANATGKSTLRNIPVYGAFCTGSYTYIWNSGYFFTDATSAYRVSGANKAELKFNTNTSVGNNEVCRVTGKSGTVNRMQCSDFKLLKVKDSSRAVCMAVAGANYTVSNVNNVFDITATSEIITETPIDLLASNAAGGGLAIYNLFVSGPAESTEKDALFYSVSFILGTLQGGANITKSGNFCSTPDDFKYENFDYCAINKFNFAAEATGV